VPKNCRTASNHWKTSPRDHNTLTIKDNLSNTWEMEAEFEALSRSRRAGHWQLHQIVQSRLKTMALAEAYTLKADGRKIAASSSGIQTQVGVASGSSGVSWPNVNVIQITFPSVQKGDRTYVRFTGAENKLSLPNWLRREEQINPTLTGTIFPIPCKHPLEVQFI